jgi:hypothetical protein
MFNQYEYIDKAHHVALQSCIRNHQTVTAGLLAQLYRIALSTHTQETVEKREDVLCSFLKTADGTKLAAVTDRKTGIYLQLASVPQSQPFLTVGQKWAVEQSNPAHGNTATLLW